MKSNPSISSLIQILYKIFKNSSLDKFLKLFNRLFGNKSTLFSIIVTIDFGILNLFPSNTISYKSYS
jgi:hypothetical protein